MSHATLIAFPVCLLLLGLGSLILVLGCRRWLVTSHPLCRKCGYDLYGCSRKTTRCPECGSDLTRRKAVAPGQFRRSPWKIAVGLGLVVPAAGVMLLGLLGNIYQDDLHAWKPFWLLDYEADRDVDEAWAELVRRHGNATLSATEYARVIDIALGRDTAPAAARVTFIEDARTLGNISDRRWKQYTKRIFNNASAKRQCKLSLNILPVWWIVQDNQVEHLKHRQRMGDLTERDYATIAATLIDMVNDSSFDDSRRWLYDVVIDGYRSGEMSAGSLNGVMRALHENDTPGISVPTADRPTWWLIDDLRKGRLPGLVWRELILRARLGLMSQEQMNKVAGLAFDADGAALDTESGIPQLPQDVHRRRFIMMTGATVFGNEKWDACLRGLYLKGIDIDDHDKPLWWLKAQVAGPDAPDAWAELERRAQGSGAGAGAIVEIAMDALINHRVDAAAEQLIETIARDLFNDEQWDAMMVKLEKANVTIAPDLRPLWWLIKDVRDGRDAMASWREIGRRTAARKVSKTQLRQIMEMAYGAGVGDDNSARVAASRLIAEHGSDAFDSLAAWDGWLQEKVSEAKGRLNVPFENGDKPMWWLKQEVANKGRSSGGWREIRRRHRLGRLSQKQLDELIQLAIETRHGSSRDGDDDEARSFLFDMRAHGLVDPDQWQRFVDLRYDVSLIAKERVSVGEPWRIEVKNNSELAKNGRWSFVSDSLRLTDESGRVIGDSLGSKLILESSRASQPVWISPRIHMRISPPPGRYTLTGDVTIEVPINGQVSRTSPSKKTLRGEVTQPRGWIPLHTDAADEPAMRAGIVIDRLMANAADRPRRLKLRALDDASFGFVGVAWVRAGNRAVPLHSIVAIGGKPKAGKRFESRHQVSGQDVQVILEPALHVLDAYDVTKLTKFRDQDGQLWGLPIVFRDVSLSK